MRDVLVDGLRAVGCDVASANTDGMRGRLDDEQLTHAMAAGRVLFSYNIRDYSRITSQSIRDGRSHAGVIVVQKERYGVGEQLRRLRTSSPPQVLRTWPATSPTSTTGSESPDRLHPAERMHAFVLRHERHAQLYRRCDDEPIGRVAVECIAE